VPPAGQQVPRLPLDRSHAINDETKKKVPHGFTSRSLTGQYWHGPPAAQTPPQYKIQTREHLFKYCPQWESQQKTLWTTEETAPGQGPHSIAELLADERCSQAVLDFLATTDVGRTSGPTVAADEDGAASEASEWDAREQAERLAEEEWLGAAA